MIMDFILKCDSVIALIYDAELVGKPLTQGNLHAEASKIIPSNELSNILHYLLDADIIHDATDGERYLFKVNSDYILMVNNILKAEHIQKSQITA